MNLTPTLLRAFRHPLVIASILVLLLNDHVLKATLPSPLTGKLSDFAGLFFFPFLLGVLIQSAGRVMNQIRRRPAARLLPARRALLVSFGLCAVIFTALKTLPAVNALAADGLARLFGLPVRIALDPTDLAALLIFYPAWRLWLHIERGSSPEPAGKNAAPVGKTAYLMLALGSLAALATAPCPYTAKIMRLVVAENDLYAYLSPNGAIATDFKYASVWRSADGGLTWAYDQNPPADIKARLVQPLTLPLTVCDPANPQQCYRVDGGPRVDESRDGGQTWQAAWQVPPERIYFIQRAADPRFLMTCGKTPDFETFDLVMAPATGSVNLVAAMGNEGLVVRRADGSWQRVGIAAANLGPLPEPTPFRARGLGQFVFSTQTEMWPILGMSLVVYLGLTQWGWIAAVRKARRGGGPKPEPGSQVLSGVLWALMVLYTGLTWVLFLVNVPDATPTLVVWVSLALLTPTMLVLSIILWDKAGKLTPQPARYGASGCGSAFGLGLLWFVIVYGVFGLWAFWVIPTYRAALVTSVPVALLAFAGAVYLLNRRLRRI